MLQQIDIFGKTKLEKTIERVQMFEPDDGYWLAFSGGKDSQCIYHLAKMAGVKFEAHYNVTSVDPPELVRFIMDNYPDVKRDHPKDKDGKVITMWSLIENETMPPTRMARYCCERLKESSGHGRVTMTGVRWAESVNRKANQGLVTIIGKPKTTRKKLTEIGANFQKTDRGGVVLNYDDAETRRSVEICYRTQKTLVNPIIDWDDSEVWEFLNEVAKVPHCSLYDEGFTRLGCIGCPLQGAKGMKRDFERWPKYKEKYITAMERMIEKHPGQIRVATGESARGGYRCSQNGSNGVPSVAEMARAIWLWWLEETL
jgi:phosphoadenosine phosphosulfate reductase